MLVGQDATTGEIWVISGNTKMKLDAGGGTPSGDHHSAGNTGHADVDAMLKMIKDSYPGSDPKFVALSNKLLSRMPEVAQLVDG